MSAYMSHRWPMNGSRHFPGDFPRGLQENEGREFRLEPGDPGIRENGLRENGLGEIFPIRERCEGQRSPLPHPTNLPFSNGPVTSGDMPTCNRSVCDGEDLGRHSQAVHPMGYSPPGGGSPGRGPPFPPNSFHEPRRLKFHNFNGPGPLRGSLPPQRPLERLPPVRYQPPLEPPPPPHPHPLHGSLRGHPPLRGRRPFYNDPFPFRPPPRPRSPILGSHGPDWQSRDAPPGYLRGYPPPHHQDMRSPLEDTHNTLSDPRVHRKSVEPCPPGGSPSEPQPSPDIDAVLREHSYCGKGPSSGEVKETNAKILPLTDPLFPRMFLSPVCKRIKTITINKPPASQSSNTPLASILKTSAPNISTPTKSASNVFVPITIALNTNAPNTSDLKTDVTAEPPSAKPPSTSILSDCRKNHWPVGDGYSVVGFTLDLDSDVDSGSEDEGDPSEKKLLDLLQAVEAVSKFSEKVSVMSSESRTSPDPECKPRVDQLVNGFITKPADPCDIKVKSHEQAGEGKMTTRRSRRLLQAVLDSPSESPAEEALDHCSDPEDEMAERSTRKKVGMRRFRRRASKRLNPRKTSEKKVKKVANQSSRKGELPTELKVLLSGDFTPEILTIRSRGESVTLARRREMEMEIEQHERERIQTARDGSDMEDSNHTPKLSSAGDIVDDLSSEHSAAMTTSSSQTMSHDQGSSHDLESGSHDLWSGSCDLESASVHSSDSIVDQFSTDLIIRCKRINTAKSSGDTPLHKVCRNGKFDMARYFLLVEKVNPNSADNAGWTPLHEAASNKRARLVKLLLMNGADANISARDGTRPIHDAIEAGSLEIVKVLVQHGADPTAELGDKTPLELAKSLDLVEIYNYLLPVVKDHQVRISAQKTSTAQVPVTRMSTRSTAKQTKSLQLPDEPLLTLPVDGFGPDDPKFGTELDYPLLYICPVLELSESPLVQVYNFEIVPGRNPRRHNFYLLSDLLTALNMTESELRHHCSQISALEMTVGEVLTSLKHPYYNRHVTAPLSMRSLPKTKKIKFLPVCSQLSDLLDIQVVNLDD